MRTLTEQVILDTGSISGIKADQNRKEIYIFRGIPYAAPPVGDLRWKPPQPATSWSGVRECTEFSVQAAQYPDIHASDKNWHYYLNNPRHCITIQGTVFTQRELQLYCIDHLPLLIRPRPPVQYLYFFILSNTSLSVLLV